MSGTAPAQRSLLPLVRGALVLVTAFAVLAALVSSGVGATRGGTLAQFVSFFTNQSNLLWAGLVLAAAAGVTGRIAGIDSLRGAATFYLAMTGIIYALLVAPLEELTRWDIGWTGIVLHRLAPAVALLDWLLTPAARAPRWRCVLLWQIYPLAFLAFTWVRGGVTGWYPYAFLDPTASSWGHVLATTLGVLGAFLLVAVLVRAGCGALARLRRRPHPGGAPPAR